MRILALTTWYPSAQDPVVGVFVARQLAAIAARHEVHVVHVVPTPEQAEIVAKDAPGDQARLPRVVLARAPGSLRHSIPQLRAHAAAIQPDVVHSLAFSALPVAAFVRAGRPWVHTEHWSGISDPASVSPRWQQAASARHLLRLPDVVTAVSGYLQDAVRPFARNGCTLVVPNVVTGPRQPCPRPDLPAGRLNLLSVGGLNPGKHPLLAVQTLAELRRRGADARLRWVGAGPLSSAARAKADDLGVSDHLELVGQVPPQDLTEHHCWSTGFFLPTQHETFCLAAAEALLHGRFVVLGARGGQRDFVTPQLGTLVSDQSPTAYADAVQQTHDRLGSVAPEEFAGPIRTRFGPVAVADAFDGAYELSIAARAGRRGARRLPLN